jgi:hypothetical protein
MVREATLADSNMADNLQFGQAVRLAHRHLFRGPFLASMSVELYRLTRGLVPSLVDFS